MFIITVVFFDCTPKITSEYSETKIMLDGADRQIPALVTLPAGNGTFPAAVMLNGYDTNKDEAENAYMLFARELAKNGIASIRIGFAEDYDSTKYHKRFDINTGVAEALKAADYIAGLSAVNEKSIGITGWSEGGTVALVTAGRDSRFKSVLTWAGALGLSRVSANTFDAYESADILAEFAHCDAPVLAVNGSKDTVVNPETAAKIKNASTNTASKSLIINGADHAFNIFTEDKTTFDNLCKTSIEWFKYTLF